MVQHSHEQVSVLFSKCSASMCTLLTLYVLSAIHVAVVHDGTIEQFSDALAKPALLASKHEY